MKIIVSEITSDGLDIEINEVVSLKDLTLSEPLKASLKVTRLNSDVMIVGVMHASCVLQCDRCLKSFTKSLDIAVDVLFKPTLSPEHSHEQYKISADELDTDFYSKDTIDLDDFLQEQILLNLPMQYFCDEDCKGLCPQCGADLNVKPCKCSMQSTDERFSKLLELVRQK